ncbi:MAG: HD domain-containing protein [Syntrophomonadaceae bacterium]|nr:HD domain-containing protein [Syntrophomonadaceae bacterium]
MIKKLCKNPILSAHSFNVFYLSNVVIDCLPKNTLSKQQIDDLLTAAVVHDIGKTTWPESLFRKSKNLLTKADWDIIRAHPAIGANMLRETGRYSEETIRIVEQHHERPGGTGYPHKIEPDLPVIILAVCDIYSACVEFRKYRKKPLSHEEALCEVGRFAPLNLIQILSTTRPKIQKMEECIFHETCN